ncbi:MAG: type II toxin-antitoxin system prevent-host-death family antitoxin [Alphaproteobacteria bacterium]|uniref:Antitoxin n=1 Tax=Candidatus Nitrobium versatile TaxID=2884831 RepID=A0A953M1W3_9BACT|nr:type II toxin-antitoxin system prevent-host-death family antitoxin [Candidatus Nitrobium versatile]
MQIAGIKELKAKLSMYIDRARKGEPVVITDHGEEVAMIIPLSEERKAIRTLIATGRARWSGEKPQGLGGITLRGVPLSETILEERR